MTLKDIQTAWDFLATAEEHELIVKYMEILEHLGITHGEFCKYVQEYLPQLKMPSDSIVMLWNEIPGLKLMAPKLRDKVNENERYLLSAVKKDEEYPNVSLVLAYTKNR
jgi:hypothetical protein